MYVCMYIPGASFDTFISARLVVVAISRFPFVEQPVCAKRPKKGQTSNYLVLTNSLGNLIMLQCRCDLPNPDHTVAMYVLNSL